MGRFCFKKRAIGHFDRIAIISLRTTTKATFPYTCGLKKTKKARVAFTLHAPFVL